MDNKRKYFIASLIPILILLGLCIKPLATLWLGQEILLQTAPYDPRDLLRGDHVVLNYQISDIPVSRFPAEFQKDSFQNKDLYVVLKKTGNHYDVDSIQIKEPETGYYLKGKIQYITKNQEGQDVAHVDYSLDKFFVPENTGTELEEKSRQGELTARVKVFKGYAYLIQVE
ncbi:GDYXXLXY domain-containing protein [Desulforamulus ruminis]|uniref:Membrane-anchored protein n=1 Tax=Desulforamulus ruminis (strain ATCC 23193 / DSM 2154 / NCIMB 8452 / DL) TaxID=696281 RepID=F6DK67_DESRL|nr:GDYXXLXY domain-containing protein [Desulforamulus ruminis]AEG60381.1 hypothetical protein Desru_2130 [Desulforamulus ruminis DSM 2154]